MKPKINKNILEKTANLLASSESNQSRYYPNYKLNLKTNTQESLQESSNYPDLMKTPIPTSQCIEELDYYKEVIKKMNTDIGDINCKLISIDNSLSTSIISGELDTRRSIDFHNQPEQQLHQTPIHREANSQFPNTNTNRVNSIIPMLTLQNCQRGESKSIPQKEDNILRDNLMEKDKRLQELETNGRALLQRNKELEDQLKALDHLINMKNKTPEKEYLITESCKENNNLNLTEHNLSKCITITDEDLSHNNKSAKTFQQQNKDYSEFNMLTDHSNISKINGPPSPNQQEQKQPIYLQSARYITKKPHKNNKIKLQRPSSVREIKRTSRSKSKTKEKANIDEAGLLKENEMLRAKMNDLKKLIANANNSTKQPIIDNNNNYCDSLERKQFIERIASLEVSFTNQVRALTTQYQSTVDKQAVKILKLTKENNDLKEKMKQIKNITK